MFKEMAYLQYEFMDKYEEISPLVHKITYSDGSVITVDYENKTYKLEK